MAASQTAATAVFGATCGACAALSGVIAARHAGIPWFMGVELSSDISVASTFQPSTADEDLSSLSRGIRRSLFPGSAVVGALMGSVACVTLLRPSTQQVTTSVKHVRRVATLGTTIGMVCGVALTFAGATLLIHEDKQARLDANSSGTPMPRSMIRLRPDLSLAHRFARMAPSEDSALFQSLPLPESVREKVKAFRSRNYWITTPQLVQDVSAAKEAGFVSQKDAQTLAHMIEQLRKELIGQRATFEQAVSAGVQVEVQKEAPLVALRSELETKYTSILNEKDEIIHGLRDQRVALMDDLKNNQKTSVTVSALADKAVNLETKLASEGEKHATQMEQLLAEQKKKLDQVEAKFTTINKRHADLHASELTVLKQTSAAELAKTQRAHGRAIKLLGAQNEAQLEKERNVAAASLRATKEQARQEQENQLRQMNDQHTSAVTRMEAAQTAEREKLRLAHETSSRATEERAQKAVESAKSSADIVVQQAEKRVEKLAENIKNEEAKTAEALHLVNDYEMKSKSLIEQFQALQIVHKNLENQNAELDEEISKEKAAKIADTKQFAEFGEKISALQQQLDTETQELALNKQQLTTASAQIQSLQGFKSLALKLQEKLRVTEENLHNIKDRASESAKVLAVVDERYVSLESEHAKLVAGQQEKQKQLESEQLKNMKLRDELKRAPDISSVNLQLKTLRDEIGQWKERAVTVEQELSVVQSERMKEQTGLGIIQKKMKNVMNDLETRTQELEAERSSMAAQQTIESQLQSQLSVAKDQVLQLSKQLSLIKNENIAVNMEATRNAALVRQRQVEIAKTKEALVSADAHAQSIERQLQAVVKQTSEQVKELKAEREQVEAALNGRLNKASSELELLVLAHTRAEDSLKERLKEEKVLQEVVANAIGQMQVAEARAEEERNRANESSVRQREAEKEKENMTRERDEAVSALVSVEMERDAAEELLNAA